MNDISELLSLNEIAKNDGKQFSKTRNIFRQIIAETGKHFTGVVGPRGVGKTVLLKQLAQVEPDSFYISVDTIAGQNLFELANVLSDQYRIKTLLLDEIHFKKDYQKELKKIYDFLKIRVVFTSSVSLSLFDSEYDLSRRVLLRSLYPFSFKEYLLFTQQIDIPLLSIDDIMEGHWQADHMRYQHLFEGYLRGKLFPFTLEEPEYEPIFRNICQKVIQKDIPMVSNLRFDDIERIEKTLTFIGKSEVDGINYSSIARNIGITKYKAELYVKLLKQAFILNPVFPKGTNVLKEPKILMHLPFRLIYKDYDESIGALREDFFAETASMKGYRFYYLKTKRGAKTPDYLVEYENGDIVIEIGGKGKEKRQFKGIDIEKKLVLSNGIEIQSPKKPLSLFGFIV